MYFLKVLNVLSSILTDLSISIYEQLVNNASTNDNCDILEVIAPLLNSPSSDDVYNTTSDNSARSEVPSLTILTILALFSLASKAALTISFVVPEFEIKIITSFWLMNDALFECHIFVVMHETYSIHS